MLVVVILTIFCISFSTVVQCDNNETMPTPIDLVTAKQMQKPNTKLDSGNVDGDMKQL